jgi:hypothetical protein
MLDYYVIYDMTQYDEAGLQSIRMGIGKKNPNINILESQYNSTYAGYAPQKGD